MSDDDTPVTTDWLKSINSTLGDMKFAYVTLKEDRTFRLSINTIEANRTATRGDFRNLARIMGYELIES